MNVISWRAILDRKWLQWSLRSLLILMLLLGVGFAWWGGRLRREAHIKDAVHLIAASPGWFGNDDYDPISLVRAVNAVHALGRSDALVALRRFAKEYPSTGRPDDRHEALRFVIPLLFDRQNPEDRFPEISPDSLPWWPHLGRTDWPYYSTLIRVMDDIPFKRDSINGFGGSMEDFSYAIDWAEKSGRLRAVPLMPADDPFAAADREMIDLARISGGDAEKVSYLTGSIRDQVLRAVVHLLPDDETDKYDPAKNYVDFQWREGYRPLSDDANWEALKKICQPLGIRWSAEEEAYVTTKR